MISGLGESNAQLRIALVWITLKCPWNFFGTKQQYINKQYNKLISTVMNNLNYDDSLESVRNAKLLELQARKRVIYSAILFSNSSNFVKLGFYAKKKIEE